MCKEWKMNTMRELLRNSRSTHQKSPNHESMINILGFTEHPKLPSVSAG